MPQFSKSALLAQIAALVSNGDINIATGTVLGNTVQSTYTFESIYFTVEETLYNDLSTTPIKLIDGVNSNGIVIHSVTYFFTGGGSITQTGDVGLCYGTAGDIIWKVDDPEAAGVFLQNAVESTRYKFDIAESVYIRATGAGSTTGGRAIGVMIQYSIQSVV
jgi:hypothetical protein